MPSPTKATKGRKPAGLKAKGTKLWEDVTKVYVLRPDEVFVLEHACRALDAVADFDKAIGKMGLTVKGSMGQTVANPLITERRLHMAEHARLVKQLGLPDEIDAEPKTASSRSESARKAAEARWRA